MQPIYQHPSDLTLAVYKGEPTQSYTPLKSRRWRRGQWEALFHIIGESHAMILSYQGVVTHAEVLACNSQPSNALHSHRFSLLDTHQVEDAAFGAYVTFTASPDAPFLPMVDDGIELEFPPIFGQTPLTRVQWRCEPARLMWRTLHIYPLQTETVYVHSLSYFNFNN